MINTYDEWFAEFRRVAAISGLPVRAQRNLAPIAFTIYFDARLTPSQAFTEWVREYDSIMPSPPGVLAGLERAPEPHAPLGLPVTAAELSEMCFRL